MNWFGKQRQEWIAESIEVYGFIRREHIMKKFDVSMTIASRDLQIFMKKFPNKIAYDKSRKLYARRS